MEGSGMFPTDMTVYVGRGGTGFCLREDEIDGKVMVLFLLRVMIIGFLCGGCIMKI